MPSSKKIEHERNRDPKPSRRPRIHQSEPADWSLANVEVLVRALCAVTSQGGALRFGYTSDGGAYAIGVYGDGDPYTEYVRPSEDIDAFLEELANLWLPK